MFFKQYRRDRGDELALTCFPEFAGADGIGDDPRVAVVIPSFRAAATIASVIEAIGPDVWRVYVVDDACPDATGDAVMRNCREPRVRVLRNAGNLGVGGAMKRGYRTALADGADIIVKLDADGQMDPRDIPALIEPIQRGRADYTKGNRFAHAGRSALRTMPLSRRFANRMLSALHRPATGCWNVADPANGFTAISSAALRRIDLSLVSSCFFFETDMLCALGRKRMAIAEIALPARYSGEVSSVRLPRVAPRFAALLFWRGCQRIAAAVNPG